METLCRLSVDLGQGVFFIICMGNAIWRDNPPNNSLFGRTIQPNNFLFDRISLRWSEIICYGLVVSVLV